VNDLRQLLIYVWAGAEQSITDDAFDQWHTHLHACIQATANALLMCPVSSATQLSHIASLIPGMACSLIVSVSGRQGNWTLWTRLLGGRPAIAKVRHSKGPPSQRFQIKIMMIAGYSGKRHSYRFMA